MSIDKAISKNQGTQKLERILGMSYKDALVLGEDVDTVTGATRSMSAITVSVRHGIRDLAKSHLKFDVPAEKKVPIQFGFPEVIITLEAVLFFQRPQDGSDWGE